MDRDQLIQRAIVIESETYFEHLRNEDGSPYSYVHADPQFWRDAVTFLGHGKSWEGYDWLRAKVRERLASGEEWADPECGIGGYGRYSMSLE